MKLEKIVYAGHSAVFLSGDEYTVAIDPWLDNPLCPQNLKEPRRIDLIVLSHGHSDHASNALSLAKKYRAKVAAPYELLMVLQNEGLAGDQLVLMNKGGTVVHDGLRITLTHAMHSSSYDTKTGTVYAGEPCGIVIQEGNSSVYHAGDTALFSDMRLIADLYQPKVALLPIGDRFTMGPQEAAKAVELLRCKVAIPIHHSTFPLLTGTPDQFKAACKNLDVEVVALAPGESYSLVGEMIGHKKAV